MHLHVEVRGEGPTLVLGHGFGGSARNFRPQARAFAKRQRVVLFDARGHARSEAPENPDSYRPECFVADVGRVAGKQPAVVGGLSMGAGVALRYALAHPERVLALLLAAFPRSGAETRDWALAFADAIEARGVDQAGAEFVWGARSRFDPKGARLIRQGFLEHSAHGLVHVLRRLLAVQPSVDEMRTDLAKLGVPVLLVVGSDDAISLEVSRQLGETLPSAELSVIEGAGHVVNLTEPKAFNRLVDGFLSRVLQSSAR